MNNVKATVIISSKLVIGMYKTGVFHFLHDSTYGLDQFEGGA